MIQVKVTETTSGNFFIEEFETMNRAEGYAAYINRPLDNVEFHLKAEIIKE